jgi:hypothetical protein
MCNGKGFTHPLHKFCKICYLICHLLTPHQLPQFFTQDEDETGFTEAGKDNYNSHGRTEITVLMAYSGWNLKQIPDERNTNQGLRMVTTIKITYGYSNYVVMKVLHLLRYHQMIETCLAKSYAQFCVLFVSCFSIILHYSSIFSRYSITACAMSLACLKNKDKLTNFHIRAHNM